MGLKLIVKKSDNDEFHEFSHIDLPHFIYTAFNHQQKPKPGKTITLEEAQELIQSFEGSNQIRLDKVKNKAKHTRMLGVLAEGKWEDEIFKPQVVHLIKADFEKGRLSKKPRILKKTSQKPRSLEELISKLTALDMELLEESLQASEFSQSNEEQSSVCSASSSGSNISPAEDLEHSQASDEFVMSSLSEERGAYSQLETFSLKQAGCYQTSAMLESSLSEDAHSEEAHSGEAHSKEQNLLSSQELVRSVDNSSFASPNPKLTAPPMPQTQATLNFPKSRSWAATLSETSFVAGYIYGATRLAQGLRLIAATSISVTAAWVGLAAVGISLIRAKRESYKRQSLESMTHLSTSSSVEDLKLVLRSLPQAEWASIKTGFESHNSLLSQFKSCFSRNNYQKGYYAGLSLGDVEPNLDVKAIEQQRKSI